MTPEWKKDQSTKGKRVGRDADEMRQIILEHMAELEPKSPLFFELACLANLYSRISERPSEISANE
ncbi:hypothetical protein GCM10022270_16040 [Terriglobus aquaticus]